MSRTRKVFGGKRRSLPEIMMSRFEEAKAKWAVCTMIHHIVWSTKHINLQL